MTKKMETTTTSQQEHQQQQISFKKYAISGSLKSCFKHTETNKKNTIRFGNTVVEKRRMNQTQNDESRMSGTHFECE